jgi:hypothetical protein
VRGDGVQLARSPDPVAATTVPSVRNPAGRPGGRGELGGERGPAGDRLDASAEQLLLARPRLRDGASMPPATQEAPDAGSGSRTVTRRPCCAARQAQLNPMTPAPSTSSSDVLCSTISLPAPA